MASLIQTTTIFALLILGTQAGRVKPFSKVPQGGQSAARELATEMGTSASVNADGFLEIEAKVDLHVLLDILQQIPFMKEKVLLLLQEVNALKEKGISAGIWEKIEHLKKDLIKEVHGAEKNIISVVERSKSEGLVVLERIIAAALEHTTNTSSKCDQNFVLETTTQVSNAIIQNNKNLEIFFSKQIGLQLSKITSIVESNSKKLSEMDRPLHPDGRHPGDDDGPNPFDGGQGNCEKAVQSTKEELKKELNSVKHLLKKLQNEIPVQIEITVNTVASSFEQRLTTLEILVKQAVDGIAALTKITQAIGVRQEEYFSSAVTETTEVVQVVRKTHHYVKQQADSNAKAVARIEDAAKTLQASRSMGCGPSPKQ